MSVEKAAKIVLTSPHGIILPYGESRRLNLPGGGVEEGELPIEALGRELEEEIGLPIDEIAPLWIGKRIFHVTSKTGEAQVRHWDIFAGRTEFSPSELMFGDDIQGVEALSREKILSDQQKVNRSVKVAVALAFSATRSSWR